jgi:hypothetical protein
MLQAMSLNMAEIPVNISPINPHRINTIKSAKCCPPPP